MRHDAGRTGKRRNWPKTSVPDRVTPPSVLISAGELAGGGVKTHAILLIKLLRREGAAVTVIGTDRGWEPHELTELADLGVNIHVPPRWMSVRKWLGSMYAALNIPWWSRGRFSSVYLIGTGRSHLWLSQWLGSRAPIIYHEILCDPTHRNMIGRCALASDAVVANSRRVASQFYPVVSPSIPVKVIPFLTAGESLAEPPPSSACGDRELRVVYLGRVSPHKRPDQLVREWRELTTAGPLGPARLDIFGYSEPSNFARELEQIVKESGLEREVCLHGPYSRDEVDSIICSADMVVLPSLWEGLPLVLVEAMRRGVPIVATDVGGVEELADGNSDVIVTSSDWAEFANGLQRMAVRIRRGEINSVHSIDGRKAGTATQPFRLNGYQRSLSLQHSSVYDP